ncbi:MAG: ACP S-malonyltransferase [Chloroflexi bacterium]|nr:ACP S-malonyltransferase [Chloroflexota bacterium]
MAEERKVAYVFPGQGSQRVGMGQELYHSSPQARAVFEEADAALDFPLTRLCFEGPDEVLRQTCNAQPAILAVSIAYLRASPKLQDQVPAFVAGHSLGEYTALVAARALDFAQAVYLARERGRLMQEAGNQNPGGMVAILGLEETLVNDVCEATGTQIANMNCPGQIVISGAAQDVARAADLARAKGARSVIPLQVSGAFHSRLMRPAAEGMAHVISDLAFRDPIIPIVANTTAQPLTYAEAVKAELLHQLCHCVQWQKSVEYMVHQGVCSFVEIGPGQVLTGLIRRAAKQAEVMSTEGKG